MFHIPPTAPCPDANRAPFTFAEARQQLGHFFWMALIAIPPTVMLHSWWIPALLVGVELISFWFHVGDHHERVSWLDSPLVLLLGCALFCVAVTVIIFDRPLILPRVLLVIIGTQLASYAIHRLAHRRADEDWRTVWSIQDCLLMLVTGLMVAYCTLTV